MIASSLLNYMTVLCRRAVFPNSIPKILSLESFNSSWPISYCKKVQHFKLCIVLVSKTALPEGPSFILRATLNL